MQIYNPNGDRERLRKRVLPWWGAVQIVVVVVVVVEEQKLLEIVSFTS